MCSIVRDLRGIVSSPARKRSPVASSALHEGYTFFGSDARARWLRGVPVCSSHDACHATTRDTLVASSSRGTLPCALVLAQRPYLLNNNPRGRWYRLSLNGFGGAGTHTRIVDLGERIASPGESRLLGHQRLSGLLTDSSAQAGA